MSSLLSRLQHDATFRSALKLPFALLVACVLANATTSAQHSLSASAAAWLVLCALSRLRSGARSLLAGLPSQRLAWAAGGALTLAQLCERAVNGRGIWWAKALPPIFLYSFVRSGLLEDPSTSSEHSPASPDKPSRPSLQGSRTALLLLTSTGLATVYVSSGSIAITALGISSSLLVVAALHLVDKAHGAAQSYSQSGGGVIYSAHGLFTQPLAPSGAGSQPKVALLTDVSAAAFVTSALAAVAFERLRFSQLPDHGPFEEATDKHSELGEGLYVLLCALGSVSIHAVANGFLLLMIQRQGALLTSFVPLSAIVIFQLARHFSLASFWFAALYTASVFLYFEEQDVWSSGSRLVARGSRSLTLAAFLSFIAVGFNHTWRSQQLSAFSRASLGILPPGSPLGPVQFASTHVHPIHQLVQDKQMAWEATLNAQSQTLESAVNQYKRRYGIPPPPNFDKWYTFAKDKGVQMIDEYDTVYNSLLPFWALSPATIRGRTREALGFSDNQLMGLMIRDGQVLHFEGGEDWIQEAVGGMIKPFVQHLPDMDLAFNLHDEPRVVVPHDELSRLVHVAHTENMRSARENSKLKNAFSARPEDLGNEKRFEDTKRTRFNVYAHQPTWLPSRLSCSPDSQARALDDVHAADNLTAYALGQMGFIYNHTAFSDVCNSPSFSRTHGFFDRPNAFNLVHDLFPVFSQSKMSSFQDIVYPSPWYWAGKVSYDEEQDKAWAEKNNSLWWRGSTTGGFSRNGGWRRQHRQQLIGKLNALDTAKVYQNSHKMSLRVDPASEWTIHDVPRQDYANLVDVHFSHVGQCDDADCAAQREFFTVVEPAAQHEAWSFKYLLDMDGNAFSGRFYAFLKSHSMTFKMAVFREWHEEWVKPWVHYIPLSLRGEEALEAVRYFDAEEEGQRAAPIIAEAGRDWAKKALRNEDFEAWFFRLLLEYGRVVDDNRESLGFSMA